MNKRPLPEGLCWASRNTTTSWDGRYAQPDQAPRGYTPAPPSLSPAMTLAAILQTSYPNLSRITN